MAYTLELQTGLLVSENAQDIYPVSSTRVGIGFRSARKYCPAVNTWITLARLLVYIQTQSFKQTGLRHCLGELIADSALVGTGRMHITDVSKLTQSSA